MIKRKLFRFVTTGLITTSLHVVIVYLLINFKYFNAPTSNGIAFVIATLFSYLVNTMWSFSNKLKRKNAIRFVMISCVGLVLSVSISKMVEDMGLHYWYGVLGVVTVVPILTFMMHTLWTYK